MDVHTLLLDLLQVLVFYKDTASFNSIVDMSCTTRLAAGTEAEYHTELVPLLALCTVDKKPVPVMAFQQVSPVSAGQGRQDILLIPSPICSAQPRVFRESGGRLFFFFCQPDLPGL